MRKYKIVMVCKRTGGTDVHCVRVPGWGENEAEYNARKKIRKFYRNEYDEVIISRIEEIK